MTNDKPATDEAVEMTQGLLPCPRPWCSDSKPTLKQGGFRNRTFVVECDTCGTRGPEKDDIQGPSAAIAAWNTHHRARVSDGREALAYLHTLHMEGGQTYDRLTMSNGLDPDDARVTAFGVPGRDYSEEYSVSTTPLYALTLSPDDKLRGLRDKIAEHFRRWEGDARGDAFSIALAEIDAALGDTA